MLVLALFKEQSLTMKMNLKAPTCSTAFLFYKTHRDTFFNSLHQTKIPLANNDRLNIYEIRIPASLYYFRFDPCEGFHDTEIASIEIIGRNKTEIITKDTIKSWKCENCIFEDTNKTLRIKALNNDPIIWNPQFDALINDFNSPRIDLLVKIVNYVFFVCISIPFLLLLIMKTNKTLIFALLIYITAVIAIVINFKRIKGFFPPAEIQSQKIVGNVHYFGYPFSFDIVLFLAIVLLPFFIFFLINISKRK